MTILGNARLSMKFLFSVWLPYLYTRYALFFTELFQMERLQQRQQLQQRLQLQRLQLQQRRLQLQQRRLQLQQRRLQQLQRLQVGKNSNFTG